MDDLIAAADHLVNPRSGLASIDDLRAEVDLLGDVSGGLLTEALRHVRVGSESARETELRLALMRGGLPEPELNWELHDLRGRLVARLDQAHPHFRVAVEYDGRGHASDSDQFRRDADRWDAIRAEGWHLERVLHHHLRPDPTVAVRKVTDALIARGWRPGIG